MPSMEALGATLGYGVLFLALMVIPYSIIAILFRYHDPRLVQARRTRGHPIQYLNRMVRINMVGVAVVLANYGFRVYNRIDPIVQPIQPVWSFVLSMATSFAFLVILFMPSVDLVRLKFRITSDEEKGDT